MADATQQPMFTNKNDAFFSDILALNVESDDEIESLDADDII